MLPCAKCGKQSAEEDVFCRDCGERLVQGGAAGTVSPVLEGTMKDKSPGKVAVLGLITLGIYWVFWFYKACRQLDALRGSDRRPGPRALLFFLAVTPLGSWLVINTIVSLIMRSLLSSGFSIPLFSVCSMAALGAYLLSSAAKDTQALHLASGSTSGFKHPVGYAVASQFGPFVIPFFVARLQSELNRYQKIRGLALDGSASGTKQELFLPSPLPRLAIASGISGMVLFTVALLAAIAIPSFSSHKDRVCNSAAVSDLRNGKTCAEAYYADYSKYPDRLDEVEGCGQPSTGVHLVYEKTAPDKYLIMSSHEKGNREYRSSQDGNIYSREKNKPDSEWQRQ